MSFFALKYRWNVGDPWKMRIVLCSREFPGLNPSGGIGVYTEAMARELVRSGHQVVVITEAKKVEEPAPKKRHQKREPLPRSVQHPDGFRIELIQSMNGFSTDPHGYSYQLYKKLRRLKREWNYDLVEFPEYQGEGYFAIKAKRLLGAFRDVTLVVHSHMSLEFCDQLNEEHRSLYRQAIFNIERYALKYADVATVPCEDLGDQYQNLVRRAYARKWHPIPQFRSSHEARAVQDGVMTLLYVGRMEHRKGVDLLVQSAVRLLDEGHRFRLRLIGGDTYQQGLSYRTKLLKLIPARHMHAFEFMGPVDRNQLTREYQSATACVFPSRFENWPNVCLEAMSYGRAVIASKFGGMREMLADGAGWLVDPFNPEELDAALRRALKEPEQVRQVGERAMARVQEYQRQGTFDYRTLLEDPAPPREALRIWPKVSIVVPCYNSPATIDRTVKSLLGLNYPEFEIILVDDGSTDGAFVSKLDQWGQKDSRIRVYHKTNSGLPGARNYGALKADGAYLAFCDADDLLQARTVAAAVEALESHPDLAFVSPILRYFGDIRGVWGPQDLYLPTILAENQVHAGLVIRRSVFEDLKGYDESFVFGWEDWDFAIRLAKAGYLGEVLPVEGYIYRVHNSSMVRTTTYERRVMMYKQLWRKHEELLGVSGAFVLDRELNLPGRGYDGMPHHLWLRERILRLAPVRFVVFVARFVPRPIKSPIRRLAKQLILHAARD